MNFSNWMGELPDCLTKVPLGHLAIPGSHNSFTCSLQKPPGASIDQPGVIRKLVTCCCGAGRTILHRWSVTQTLTLVEQLHAGIRYFDLRVCKNPDTGQFHFVHGLYGSEIGISLSAVKAFFKVCPKEVAIFDMNHFYNMDPEDHDSLLAEVMGSLGDLLVPVNGYQYKLWSLTLDNIWEKSGRIILIYHNPFNAALFPKIWNKTFIQSPWPNTPSLNILLDFLDAHYTNKYRPSGYSFYVWQGVLSPRTNTIVKNIHRTLKQTLAARATEEFVKWVREKAPGESRINICMVDFIEEADFVKEVIGLNMITKYSLYDDD